jgi:iron-sulfur cluster repair protein YtfE (RIC family)
MISKETLIEDLVVDHPEAIALLMRYGLKCIACGEPLWGTIGQAADDKGLPEGQLAMALDELNREVSGA